MHQAFYLLGKVIFQKVHKLWNSSFLCDNKGTEALEYIAMAAIVTPSLVQAAQMVKAEVLKAYGLIVFNKY